MRSTTLPAGPDIAPGYLQAIYHCPMLSAETVSNLGVVWVGLITANETVQNLGGLSAIGPGEATGLRAGKARCSVLR
jgi:hypothetical protein